MRHRHAITDELWVRIRDLLPGKPGDPGVTAKDNRLFVDAVLWIAKTGAPGVTCRNASAAGTTCGNASAVGPRRGFGSASSPLSKTPTWSG
jgi:transposase